LFLGLRKTLLTSLVFEHLSLAQRKVPRNSHTLKVKAPRTYRVLNNRSLPPQTAVMAVVLDAVEEIGRTRCRVDCRHALQMNFMDDPIEVVLSVSIHTKMPSAVYVNALSER
jgi:hypothetical protein